MMRLDLPIDCPLATQAFIFWLALVVWAREDAAIAGSWINVVARAASTVPRFALDGPPCQILTRVPVPVSLGERAHQNLHATVIVFARHVWMEGWGGAMAERAKPS
jgi:hypothetical protein